LESWVAVEKPLLKFDFKLLFEARQCGKPGIICKEAALAQAAEDR